jgi:hypothetical protein
MQAKQPIMSLGVAEIVCTYRILRLVVRRGFRNTYPTEKVDASPLRPFDRPTVTFDTIKLRAPARTVRSQETSR